MAKDLAYKQISKERLTELCQERGLTFGKANKAQQITLLEHSSQAQSLELVPDPVTGLKPDLPVQEGSVSDDHHSC